MTNLLAEMNYKTLYETALIKINRLEQEIEAKKNENRLLDEVRKMQTTHLLAYEKQIKDLGAKPVKATRKKRKIKIDASQDL